MEAKRIIDSQLAFAPSCEELSRMVHLSMTKLTRGFSSFYGMPIHQYVIEQRLAQAAQLLLEGDWNVSEVAAIVGYGKASNFAAAFKKRYGVAPKIIGEAGSITQKIKSDRFWVKMGRFWVGLVCDN